MGEARDILLRQSRLAQYYQEFCRKALLLVIPTVLEIFYQYLSRKALLLVIPTVLEIFYQYLCRKALRLVIPTVLEIFYQDLCRKALLLVIPKTRNILNNKICAHHTKALILVNPTVIKILNPLRRLRILYQLIKLFLNFELGRKSVTTLPHLMLSAISLWFACNLY